MANTARGKFEGGDAAWEESRLSSYSKSEVRLTEIQELLCKEITKGNNQVSGVATKQNVWAKQSPYFFAGRTLRRQPCPIISLNQQ